MKYVYLITNDFDYEGYSVVSVETSAKKAIEVAEENLSGDYTTVSQYQIGHGEYESTMIAQWKYERTGAKKRKYKRLT